MNDRSSRPARLVGWGFAAACGLLPVLTLGGIIPAASAALAACLCLGIARRFDWTLGRRVAACAVVTALCWGFVIGLLVTPWTLTGLLLGSNPQFLANRRAGGQTQTGPWGELRFTSIAISPPLEQVDLYGTETRLPWLFPNTTAEQLQSLLKSAGIKDDQLRQIMASARREESLSGMAVHPDDALVAGLDSQARSRIYHWLGMFAMNPGQNSAFRHTGSSVDEWLSGAGLAPAVVDRVKKLSYRHGNSVFFADLSLVLRDMSNREQKARLVKALARQKTMLIDLRVTADSNIDALVNYWGRGRRAKDVRPVLESLAQVPGGGRIDVAHLMPGFARRRLYTYPTPKPNDGPPYLHDCGWSALNFFADQPEDRFGDPAVQSEELRMHYYRIHSNPALGDVVVFSDQGGQLFHMAVYVADDILFTKNGPSFSQPWMFIHMDEMKDFYPRPGPIEIHYFRHEDL